MSYRCSICRKKVEGHPAATQWTESKGVYWKACMLCWDNSQGFPVDPDSIEQFLSLLKEMTGEEINAKDS